MRRWEKTHRSSIGPDAEWAHVSAYPSLKTLRFLSLSLSLALALSLSPGQETRGSETPVRRTTHPTAACEATGGCVFGHGRALIVIISCPRSVKLTRRCLLLLLLPLCYILSLFPFFLCIFFHPPPSRMSSPLFLGQLVGVPLEIMHPTMEKDTTYTKIFVGGLPYHTNDASLRKYFETFGDIDEAVVITDKQTGKSRGYGFVTMVDRGAAERACKDANPIIDGRKANVNLAYLGAKPRSSQTSLSVGVQQVHPTWAQRQYGLAQQYVYPQAFLQPSLLLQSHLSPTAAALTSPYLDYSSAYSPYAPTGLEQYPYTPSPSPSAGYLSYSYSPGTPAPALTASPTPPAAIHPPLAALTTVSGPQAFLHYPLHQPDRMQ